jgi:hypothetical protein
MPTLMIASTLPTGQALIAPTGVANGVEGHDQQR